MGGVLQHKVNDPTEEPMRKSRFSDEKILGVLKEAEAGVAPEELCRKYGISKATLHRWKGKYGGAEVNELRRLRQLEEENGQLKRLVAEQALDILGLKNALSKKY